MRLYALAFLLPSLSSATSAAGELGGSFTCVYAATWGCAPPTDPRGICVDSGHRQPGRFALQLNFDSKPFPSIRLNGLDGHLQRKRDVDGYSVHWHLGGLGHPTFSTSLAGDEALTATFLHTYPDGGRSSSSFECTRAQKTAL